MRKRNKQKQSQAGPSNALVKRTTLIYALVTVFAVAVLVKVIHIQLFEGDVWRDRVSQLTTDLRTIPATRGNIYGADGSLLATSIPVYEIRMDLAADGLSDDTFFGGLDSLSLQLSNLFKDRSATQYKKDLLKAHRAGKRYYLVKRDVSFNEVKKAKEFPIFRKGRYKGGVIIEKHTERQHPFGLLASRTIGYERANVQPVGLEGAYNSHLRGRPGSRYEKRLAGGIWMPVTDKNEVEPRDGADIVTTIDVNIQDVATQALRQQLVEHNADHGCAVLMEVETGYVRAIANLSRVDEGEYREDYNYAVGEATEPGSTFKLPALIAAFEDDLIELDDSVDTENGRHRFYDRIMRDSNDKGYGKISVQQAFEKSSNVGISKIVHRCYKDDPGRFVDRLYNMGLNEPLGVEISGEGKPKIKTPEDPTWSGVSLPWMSIGYEVLMTPLQILSFYNAIANDGTMVRPQFVSAVMRDGQMVRQNDPEVLKPAVCSKSTLKNVRTMLEGVVQNSGTASNLKNLNYTIAGKTGTAQIANDKYGYEYDQEVSYQASFVGYFPADEPRYSCIVVVNGPTNDVYYGNQVAGPIFKEIADKVYAQELDMLEETERPKLAGGEVRIPVSKHGKLSRLREVYEELNVPVEDLSKSSEWVHTYTQQDTVEVHRLKVLDGMVPNVLGMGLSDALYLLESKGLDVKVNGAGAVKKQSLPPGSRLDNHKSIRIELS